jgi:hypothetical protein
VKRSALSRNTPLKRSSKLRIAGKSEVSEIKRDIQALLREIVIKRDKKCQRCGVASETPNVVFQCDHLLSRAHSATFADSRLCVLLCRPCHGWKSLGSNLRKAQYDHLIKLSLSKDRVELWDKCEQDSWRPVQRRAYDWQLAKVALENELALSTSSPEKIAHTAIH